MSEWRATSRSFTVSPMRKWLRRIGVTFGLGFTAWLAWNSQAHGVNPTMRPSSASVTVIVSGGMLHFLPRAASPPV